MSGKKFSLDNALTDIVNINDKSKGVSSPSRSSSSLSFSKDQEKKENNKENDKIVLRKKDDKNDPKLTRQTFYLTDELINKIQYIKKQTKMGKSDIVRMGLEYFFRNADID